MKKLRAKFKVNIISQSEYGTQLDMEPVYEENGINKEWSSLTPAGKLEMTITNKDADLSGFTPGTEFYLDLIPVTAEKAPGPPDQPHTPNFNQVA